MLAIAGSRFANAYIIHALIGSVTVAIDIAVEDYYRNALLIHLINNRGNSIGFVRGYDNNVEVVFHEVFNIGYLLFIAVFGGTNFDFGIGVENKFTVNFFVAFVAPVVATALRNTYSIYLFFLAS